MMGLVGRFKKFGRDEDGATAIEYGIIAALIAVAIVFGVSSVGTQLGTTFGNVKTELENAGS